MLFMSVIQDNHMCRHTVLQNVEGFRTLEKNFHDIVSLVSLTEQQGVLVNETQKKIDAHTNTQCHRKKKINQLTPKY